MTLREAIALLDAAPYTDQPSAINPNLTQKQSVDIVRAAAATLGHPKDKPCGLDDQVHPIVEKHVWQVSKDQKRPRY